MTVPQYPLTEENDRIAKITGPYKIRGPDNEPIPNTYSIGFYSGEVNWSEDSRFSEELSNHSETHPGVCYLINFQGVEKFSSQGKGTLVMLKNRGHRIILTNLKGCPEEGFKVTQLDTFFEIIE